uniref:LRRCT domain-containing protein n=1 Tax=Syphacia muris TaxID=451379 RepID=A0A0N5AKK6_9BILA
MQYFRDLSENYLSVLTDKQLQGPKLINNLQLNNNFLTCLDTEVISTWTNLEILALNRNNLSSLNELSELRRLRSLRLADNMWLCDCRLRWMQKLLNDSTEKKDFKLDTPKCQKPVHLHMKRISNVKQRVSK